MRRSRRAFLFHTALASMASFKERLKHLIPNTLSVFLLFSLACTDTKSKALSWWTMRGQPCLLPGLPGKIPEKVDLNPKQRQSPPLTSSLEFSLLTQVCVLPHPGSIIKDNNHLRRRDAEACYACHRNCQCCWRYPQTGSQVCRLRNILRQCHHTYRA